LNSENFVANDNLQIWDEIFKKRSWGKYPPIPLVRFVARNFFAVPDRRSVRILELGSGPGANLWFMAREGFCVYGIDGSPAACEIASQRLRDEKLDNRVGRIVVGDYFDQLDQFADDYFDAIIDVESLCCNPFERTRQIIARAFSKLNSGGRMFSIAFADGTWGLEGENVDHHALYPVEGPLAGEGFNRFTTREDIEELYKCASLANLERQELLFENGHKVCEWLIETQKR
jgi:SAM-dependent methyltransferase